MRSYPVKRPYSYRPFRLCRIGRTVTPDADFVAGAAIMTFKFNIVLTNGSRIIVQGHIFTFGFQIMMRM